MPKKKSTVDQEQIAPDVPPMPTRGREVVYSIMVPNCNNTVAIERARRALHEHVAPAHLIHIGDGFVSVPRLYTLWQDDNFERVWQQAIKHALPDAIIDVADWTPAPGYPQGEIGEAKETA